MQIKYRLINKSEYEFLEEMLYEAIFVPEGKPRPSKSIMEHPDIKKYVESWNQKEGDIGIVAHVEGKLIGAIWGRRFLSDNRGYGYIDDETPEIGLAVKKEYRNRGIGTGLLNRIENEYLRIGIDQISLSVDKLNPARSLYQRSGYEVYVEKETSIIMIKKISLSSGDTNEKIPNMCS